MHWNLTAVGQASKALPGNNAQLSGVQAAVDSLYNMLVKLHKGSMQVKWFDAGIVSKCWNDTPPSWPAHRCLSHRPLLRSHTRMHALIYNVQQDPSTTRFRAPQRYAQDIESESERTSLNHQSCISACRHISSCKHHNKCKYKAH